MERVTVPAEEGLQENAGEKAANTKTVEEVVGRPEWLPENFESVEQFLESHNNLRADHTRKSQELAEFKKATPAEDDGKPSEAETPPVPPPPPLEGEQAIPGVSNEFMQEISDHAWENGSLTEDHYEKLAEAGYSKGVVDQYMEGQMNAAQSANDALLNAGGGAENVQSMFDWAQANLSDAEVESYNSKFANGGTDGMMAMEHLKSRYESSGDAPSGVRVSGGNAPSGDSATYKSVAQVQADMSDPRYKTDPAYRDAVADKLGRSNVL